MTVTASRGMLEQYYLSEAEETALSPSDDNLLEYWIELCRREFARRCQSEGVS